MNVRRLVTALRAARGSRAAAARMLGISRPTLYRWMRCCELKTLSSRSIERFEATVTQNARPGPKGIDAPVEQSTFRAMQTAALALGTRRVAIRLSPRHRAILKRLAVEQAIQSGRGRDSLSEVVAALLERAERSERKPDKGRPS